MMSSSIGERHRPDLHRRAVVSVGEASIDERGRTNGDAGDAEVKAGRLDCAAELDSVGRVRSCSRAPARAGRPWRPRIRATTIAWMPARRAILGREFKTITHRRRSYPRSCVRRRNLGIAADSIC